MKDQMTPIERMTAYFKGQDVDRQPCSPKMGETMCTIIGASPREYYFSAEKMAQTEIALYQELKHDSLSISATLRGVAEAMGSKIKYFEDSIPIVERPAISKIEEIDSLKPSNPEKDGRLPLVIKALKILQKELGHEVGIGAGLAGPFTTASAVVGTENLLKWMIKYPEKVHTLMEIIVESNNRFIDQVGQMGLGVGFSDPVASTSLISLSQYDKFVAPYLKMNVDHLKKINGKKASIHICGTSKDIWQSVVNTGVGSFSIDNVEDLEEAKELIGDKLTLEGNVPPVDIMQKGTREEVLEACKECLLKGYDSPKGYILSSGCQIPMHTPLENIKAMMEAARSYGSWPINPDKLKY